MTKKWEEPTRQTFILMKTSWRRLEGVFRLRLQKTSSRRLDEDEYILINHTSSEDVFKTSWSRPIYSSCPYVFKTSSRHLAKTSSRRLANTSWRHLQDVLKTYHQVKLFLLTSLWEVFNMFVRRTAKTAVYRTFHLGHTSEKFIVSVQNLQVLVFQFTTPISGCL